ncbi:MAG: hypothetical protein ACRC1T_15170 [Clostridium chrysemydis]|uniref:hypothetical protein n=2 Tax=Clostridiaceae TaxID=31979 RepID=UPI002152F7FA|nr:hypothetical protein [Clostridium sp. LY3-2]MCR6515765.1 hypothetical protein [Clostridium sp. LY3-2]
MKNKLIITLIATATILGFAGCGAKEMVDDTKNKVENATERATDDIKNTTENIKNDFSDEMLNLKLDDFIKKVEDKGYNVENLKESTDKNYNFNGKLDKLKINNEEIIIFEYPDKESLDKEVDKISNNSYLADGGKIDTNNPPQIFRSGKLLFIYNGKNQEITNLLTDILGAKIK